MNMITNVNGDTIPTTGTLVVTTCWCGIQFAMPSALMRWHRQDKSNATYCPLGHSGVVRTTDTERLASAEARETSLRDQLDAANAEAEQVRFALIRDRERFSNGVCPCCNRTFQNVLRHMRGEHPDYDPATLKGSKYECSCGRSFGTPNGLRIHQGRARSAGWAKPSTPRWSAHLTVVS